MTLVEKTVCIALFLGRLAIAETYQDAAELLVEENQRIGCRRGKIPAVLEYTKSGSLQLTCRYSECMAKAKMECRSAELCKSSEIAYSWDRMQRNKVFQCCKSPNVIVSSLVRSGIVMPGQMALFGGYRINATLFSEAIISLDISSDGKGILMMEVARFKCFEDDPATTTAGTSTFQLKTNRINYIPIEKKLAVYFYSRSQKKNAPVIQGKDVVDSLCPQNWPRKSNLVPTLRRLRVSASSALSSAENNSKCGVRVETIRDTSDKI